MVDRNHLISTGNAAKDGRRGWFVGQFMPPHLGLSHQQAVEIKWGQHAKGERRRGFAQSKGTTIAVLVKGSFLTQLRLPDEMRQITLTEPGDYVAFAPGVEHCWEALAESLVITVRFPSLKED
jgi:hypothetical protein